MIDKWSFSFEIDSSFAREVDIYGDKLESM